MSGQGFKSILCHSAVAGLAALIATEARADVEISAKPTQNMSCSNGVCSPMASKAVLNVTDLSNMLATGDVTVNTGGSVAKDIEISAALSWTSTSRLTLDAHRSITVKKPVSVTGAGALTIATNDGGQNGDLLFENKGSVTFWDLNSSLIVNGSSYTLVGDIATLAADIAANPSGFYALANAIDAKGQKFENVPIPTKFSGTLEGLGQNIAHLRIKKSIVIKFGSRLHFEGFFAYIAGGVVRDLALSRANISSKRTAFVGALVGQNTGTILHVAVDGTITAESGDVGGLAGANSGTIADVESQADVTANDSAGVGGLVGDSVGGVISLSHATGTVSGGYSSIGGLAGSASNVSQSYATGAVRGGDRSVVGGLIGEGSQIEESYATGSITAGNGTIAGGLIGYGSDISDSYARGPISVGRKSLAGGLVGKGHQVSASYSTGSLSFGVDSFIGGFIGKNELRNSLSYAYWDTDDAGVTFGCGKGDCTGVTGLTTEQFQAGLPEGFDSHVWAEDANVNGGFPYLLGIPPVNQALNRPLPPPR